MAFGIAPGAFLANAWADLPIFLAASIAIGNVLAALPACCHAGSLSKHTRTGLNRT